MGSYLRPVAAVAALVGLAAYATIMLRGPHGLNALMEKQDEIRAMELHNANLERDIKAEQEHIERLKNDPKAQEVELEKLGYVHHDDTQFKVTGQHIAPEPGTQQTTATPSR
jgi:cell division protein FtsB